MNIIGSTGIVRFTIGESIRKGTLIFYTIISVIIFIFLAIGLKLDSDQQIVLLFSTPLNYGGLFSVENAANLLLNTLFSLATFWVIFFGILATSGLFPSLLKKGEVEIFLSKPINRFEIYLGRYLGGAFGVGINILFLFFCVWFVFGLNLHIWNWSFLAAGLLAVYAFLCVFSFTALVGVITKNTGLSIILTFLLLMVSSPLESRVNVLYPIANSEILHRVFDIIYYSIPQVTAMMNNSSTLIGSNPFISEHVVSFSILPFLTSAGCTIVYLSLGILYFRKRDF